MKIKINKSVIIEEANLMDPNNFKHNINVAPKYDSLFAPSRHDDLAAAKLKSLSTNTTTPVLNQNENTINQKIKSVGMNHTNQPKDSQTGSIFDLNHKVDNVKSDYDTMNHFMGKNITQEHLNDLYKRKAFDPNNPEVKSWIENHGLKLPKNEIASQAKEAVNSNSATTTEVAQKSHGIMDKISDTVHEHPWAAGAAALGAGTLGFLGAKKFFGNKK